MPIYINCWESMTFTRPDDLEESKCSLIFYPIYMFFFFFFLNGCVLIGFRDCGKSRGSDVQNYLFYEGDYPPCDYKLPMDPSEPSLFFLSYSLFHFSWFWFSSYFILFLFWKKKTSLVTWWFQYTSTSHWCDDDKLFRKYDVDLIKQTTIIWSMALPPSLSSSSSSSVFMVF